MRKCLVLILLILCFCAGSALAEKTVLLTFTGDCTIGSTELVRICPRLSTLDGVPCRI